MAALTPGTPNTIMRYIASQKGIQTANRFHVYIQRPGEDIVDFITESVQLPQKMIKVFPDALSGSSSPIPVPYSLEYGGSLMSFIVEDSWRSRTFFENWANTIFWGKEETTLPYGRNKVAYYDDLVGQIKVQALSIGGDFQGESRINAEYNFYGCVPVQFVPANMDERQMNTVLKFQMNIAYKYYTYS